ncbi:carbamoyltransferase [Mucilaginibacter sp. X4EP1]|uniref:carbamoyltransferase family protein n=1 Tax=Mucilaginibacter sp. X4EP1 TaxID=2723092 RepID=UPI00216833B6|nr:carbamoyltransferase [Mucilaginibacter sp. X4EP1]MCS3812841.1 carbamoyltransferase [Mucilaginibacter sp. X4EP1]
MPTAILGISAYYHDSAAALIINGAIVAAAQEERFSRIKNDAGFPDQAIAYVLQEGGIDFDELTSIVFYDKPLLKFERLLETYHAFAPFGLLSFAKAIPIWIKEKLFIKRSIKKKCNALGKKDIPILFAEHHLSHAASAYYPSPFNEAAILTIDGVGEWATTTICRGTENKIEILKELRFPHSIGLLYASFTYYLGFTINSGEYKVMGLAPYGNPNSIQVSGFKQKILAELVDIREDGSILLNMDYFSFATGLKMTNNKKWELLFGFKRRAPESEIEQQHINLALAIQQVTELIVIKLAKTARDITGCKNLVMAGGVALNCVANSKIEAEGIFDNMWIQPAGGDAGGALGAAYAALFTGSKDKRETLFNDRMKGAYLGPEYTDKDVLRLINNQNIPYVFFDDFADLTLVVSQKIADGKVVGWFQGRMEFGPRALGNRSILGDPRNPEMQNIINTKIKSRESFRPFAPAVLEEDISRYFTPGKSSPYMLFTAMLKDSLRKEEPGNYADLKLYDRLNFIRADIPAVIHVDYSARIQTVNKKSNPKFWQLINDFKNLTGCVMLINTSFNVRDEPIVCTPGDAYKDFITTEMDYLVLGNFLLTKTEGL